jgi:hypothetical protein
MKAAEILRKLADMIDQHGDEGSVERPENSVQHAELAPVEVDNTDNTETTVMVAPLQAKLELLKKATGVESHYDEATPCDSAEDAELALMKQRAGIPQIVVQELGDDDGAFEG